MTAWPPRRTCSGAGWTDRSADPPGNHTWLFQVDRPGRRRRLVRPRHPAASGFRPSVPRWSTASTNVPMGPSWRSRRSATGTARGRSSCPCSSAMAPSAIYRLTDAQARRGPDSAPGRRSSSTRASPAVRRPAWASPSHLAARRGPARRPALDEIVAGGLSRASRVSRITPDGVVDVVRALPTWADDVEADGQGSIYVATQAPGEWTRTARSSHPPSSSTASTPCRSAAAPPPHAAAPARRPHPRRPRRPATPAGQPWPRAAAQPGASAALGLAPLRTAPRWPSRRTGRPARATGSARGGIDGSGPARLVDGGPGLELLPVGRWQPIATGRGDGARRAIRVGRGADGSDPVIVSETANTTGAGSRLAPCCWAPGRTLSARRRSSATSWSTGAESVVDRASSCWACRRTGGSWPSSTRAIARGWTSWTSPPASAGRWQGRRTRRSVPPGGRRTAHRSPTSSGETSGFDPAAEEDLVLKVADLAGGRPSGAHRLPRSRARGLLVG